MSGQAKLPDEIIVAIATAASAFGHAQTVARLTRLARKFNLPITAILYRRITVKKHNFDRLAAILLPMSIDEGDSKSAKKGLLRARVMGMDFEEPPDERDTKVWIDGLQRCFDHYDITGISNTALLQLTNTAAPYTTVTAETIFPNLKHVTVSAKFLELLTMILLVGTSPAGDLPQLHMSWFFSQILVYGAVDINLSLSLEWTQTKPRFIREIRGRIYEDDIWNETARSEADAIQLYTDSNIERSRNNFGLEALFQHRTRVCRIEIHSMWYHSCLPKQLRADYVTIEFAKFAGMPLANDYQPRPLCFKRMSEFHKALAKKIKWSVYCLPVRIQMVVEDDEDLNEVEGFIEGLEMEKEKDPKCVWDHDMCI
jgi:hypothetical protein